MIPLFKPYLPPWEQLAPNLRGVLYSGYIAQGPRVEEFERRFAREFGIPAENVVAVSSCTAALHLALELCRVRFQDVVSTPMTAEPTNLAILHAGGVPAWADVNALSGNLNAKTVGDALTSHTAAIMVVHYGGLPAPLDGLRIVAQSRGIPLIEDAAHALGATHRRRPIGTCGDFGCFSFQAIKHMTTADGGVLVCNRPGDADKARQLRWFGIDRSASRTEVDVHRAGWKYNMNDVTAALGLVQLEHVGAVLARHRDNGRWYDANLKGIPGLEVHAPPAWVEASYWLYTVLAEDRDGLERKLKERGVGCGRVHRRNDRHSVFNRSRRELPGLDRFWSRMLHIPCGWWVSDGDRERIAEIIGEGW